jgi:alpha-mannosidase
VIEDARRLVSEGDRGDEYNADILGDAIRAPAEGPAVETRADGASGTLTLGSETYIWPSRLRPSRRRRTQRAAPSSVYSTVRLYAGVARVDFEVTVDNRSADHRLRVHVRLPFKAKRAITENQFHVAERKLKPPKWNGTSNEKPPTTFPQKTFVAFEQGRLGVAVMNRGLPEGEVVRDRKGRQAYALTLLRCVGWLSRRDLESRKGHAGPQIATPDAQMPGLHSFEFALTTYAGSWREAAVLPLAHSFAHRPFALAVVGRDGPAAGGANAMLARFEDSNVVPSALGRSEVDGKPVVRAWNASDEARAAGITLGGQGEGGRTDLLERPLEGRGGELRGWEVGTWRWGGGKREG